MVSRASWTFALLFVLSLTLAAQAPPKPGAEVQKLAPFVGKWAFEGEAQASPYGPAGKVSTVDTFAWLPGGFFMEHTWDVKQGGLSIIGKEVIGYEAATKQYVSRFFDNLGNTGTVRGTVNGNTWTWTAESVVGGKPLKERGTNVLTGDTVTGTWEYSTDGTKWLPNFTQKGKRVK